MKKITLMAAALLLTGGLVFTTMSCSKDDDAKSCTELGQVVADAGVAYSANPSASNCSAYKAAINAYIDGCDELTQDEIDILNDIQAILNCN